MMRSTQRSLHGFVIAGLCFFVNLASANDALWQALKKGEHVLLMRHAETVPGIGDPLGFNLNDCATQRNLSDAGRAQARAWGASFVANGVAVGGVFSSRWCRCMDTARLAFGRIDTWPALNSHFDSPQFAALQAEQVNGGIAVRMQKNKVLVLVTHQVNISAIAGVTLGIGEAVVLKVTALKNPNALNGRTNDTLSVVGTLKVK
jgi:broad specificity phosphatase PhoE